MIESERGRNEAKEEVRGGRDDEMSSDGKEVTKRGKKWGDNR